MSEGGDDIVANVRLLTAFSRPVRIGLYESTSLKINSYQNVEGTSWIILLYISELNEFKTFNVSLMAVKLY